MIGDHGLLWVWEKEYRVASGFDETCGSERNSSRSIVPELSWVRHRISIGKLVGRKDRSSHLYLVQLHKSLS